MSSLLKTLLIHSLKSCRVAFSNEVAFRSASINHSFSNILSRRRARPMIVDGLLEITFSSELESDRIFIMSHFWENSSSRSRLLWRTSGPCNNSFNVSADRLSRG